MKFVRNVGKNDAAYPVNPLVNGKRETCPFYRTWVDMLARCYSPKVKQKQPTYSNCTVCEEWLTFSNFKAWMELQHWQGMRLDKDLLYPDNTQYSPQTCVFVPNAINCIFGTCGAARGEYPIGVSKDKISKDMVNFLKKPFRAAVQTLRGPRKRLGMYATAMEAHAAWQLAKVEVIREYVLWWEFEPSVSQTFNIKIAENLLSVAANIEKDLQQRVETVRFYF